MGPQNGGALFSHDTGPALDTVSSTLGKLYGLRTSKRAVFDSGFLKADFSVLTVLSDTLTNSCVEGSFPDSSSGHVIMVE